MVDAAYLEKLAGVVIGDGYRLDQHITTTGMSVVYRASDRENRVYAVKILSDVGVLARFIREAQVGAVMAHPHIVRTLNARIDPPEMVRVPDTNIDVALRYIVMPWIPGESLRDITRRRAFHDVSLQPTLRALEEARNVLLPIADALYYLHTQRGYVHRDVKPSNILFVESDQAPYLIDLGIAREIEDPDATNIGPLRETLTRVGEIVGTNRYMPPEQFVNSAVSEAADQYALAITIYELLTNGKSPYEEAMREFNIDPRTPRTNTNENEQWHRIHLRFSPTPLTDHRRDLPLEAWGVLKRALEKKPHERYASISEFARAFAAVTPNWTGYPGGVNIPPNLPPRATIPSDTYLTPSSFPAGGQFPASGGWITPSASQAPNRVPVTSAPPEPLAPQPAFKSTRERRDMVLIIIVLIAALIIVLTLILLRAINTSDNLLGLQPTSAVVGNNPSFTPGVTVNLSATDALAVALVATATPEVTATFTITASYTATPEPTLTFTLTPAPRATITLNARELSDLLNTALAATAQIAAQIDAERTGTRAAATTLTAAPTATQYAIETLIADQLTRLAATPTPDISLRAVPTNTHTATATLTATDAPTNTYTATATLTFTATDAPTNTNTATATLTATDAPTNTNTVTATLTATDAPTNTDTTTATLTTTDAPTNTHTATATYTFTVIATATAKPTDSASIPLTPTDSAKATATDTPFPTLTFTATPTDTPLPTPTLTLTATPTDTPSPTLMFTATPTDTPSPTLTFTATPTDTPLPTLTFTATPTDTPFPTLTFTATPTDTPFPTLTFTATPTDTPTFTLTPSLTLTFTPSLTFTPTLTLTPSATATPDVEAILATGARLEAAGDHIGAISAFDRAAAAAPDNVAVFVGRGESYLQLCRAAASSTIANANCDAALSDFGRALELEPESLPALVGRGRVQTALGQYAAAIADYDAALALDRTYAPSYLAYADVLLESGDNEGAIRYLTAALRLDANNAAAYLLLGEARFSRGEWGLAREAYVNYVRLSGIEPAPGLQARLDEIDSLLAGR